MTAALIGFFLCIVLSLFAEPVQAALKGWFHREPLRIFLVPTLLTAIFASVLAGAGGFSWVFLALIAVYTLAPTAVVFSGGIGARPPRWPDFIAILLLWLPIEFTTGKELLPRSVWGLANIAAHGTAVTLGLFLFLIFRDLKGVKYNLPRRGRDGVNALLGFAVAAPVLIALGLWLGFMGPYRGFAPFHAGAFGVIFLKTVLGVAIPEELLFRGLIQNWLMQKFGETSRALVAAALIFGFAHLDNAPAPNWTYVLLATIAGLIYGKVFQKSSSIVASASLHAFVNTIRHVFFG